MLTSIFWCLLQDSSWAQSLEEARAAIRSRDYSTAAALYEVLARSGDTEAVYQLAGMYRAGRGVTRDPQLAMDWMRKAAQAGDARAQYAMGQWLQDSPEYPDGEQEGRRWYEMAAAQGHPLAARLLDSEKPETRKAGALETSAEQQRNMLIQATRQGNTGMIQGLLSGVTDRSLFQDSLNIALYEAISAGRAEIAALLLQNGADSDGPGSQPGSGGGLIPLHAAVRSGNPALVTMLLAAGASTEQADSAGNTALMIAAAAGDTDLVTLLLAGGANINTSDNRAGNALTAARQKGHHSVERILLDHGAREPGGTLAAGPVNVADLAGSLESEAGWPPLMYAAWRGELARVKTLLSKGSDVDARSSEGHTALSRAAWQGHAQITALLLAAGADPNIHQGNGNTPLIWATLEGHRDVIRLLVDAQANLDAVSAESGYNALLLACSRQDEETVSLLLDLGATLNARSDRGVTALMLAAELDAPALTRILLDRGSDPSLEDHRGRSAIWFAINAGRSENLELLLKSGAGINEPDSAGQRPLIEAVRAGNPFIVEMLLNKDADPDLLSTSGNSALIVAATNGQVDVMKILLDKGANPDVRNNQGYSALMRAAVADQIQAARVLLEAGANPRLVNRDHKTALDLAKDSGHQAIVELLDTWRRS